MTPDEAQEIADVGQVLFVDFEYLIINCTLYAFFISVYIYSQTYTPFRRKDTTGWAGQLLIGLLGTAFVIVTLNTLAYGIIVSLPGGLPAQEDAADSQPLLNVWGVIEIWTGNLIYLMADTIIVWRAWAIWDNRPVHWLLSILMFANIGVNIADSVADTRAELEDLVSGVTLDWVNVALSFAVNVVATSLIAYKAWDHHKAVKGISTRNKKTPVESILLLLVESGAIFGILQVALDVNQIPESNIGQAEGVIGNFYNFTAALNPVAIFILVQTQTTYEHSMHISSHIGKASTEISIQQSTSTPAIVPEASQSENNTPRESDDSQIQEV
ncbi:hypothetical protein BT96DRAFT_935654 [Gymnopus androsaceus JB14]|uniref:Uncharacterized protein n=1 Tax=Gymnopus androsaceus JB14 TaxID=1447944 RepID=A0A6A4I5Z1_9AGAR|nr:hypothetical protein BT96DRAFT_935654 [Gymnopus androsaceus JB14]